MLHRAYVAGRLWLDVDQRQANRCLRSTLWRLGRLSPRLVVATGCQLGLAQDVPVDVRELEAAAARVLPGGPPGPADTDLRCLVDAADLLPDWYDDWLPLERERLRQVRLIALDALAHDLLDGECHREATLAAIAAVAADPLRESAQRTLIRCHLAAGNVGDALQQMAAYRGQLASELGLEPSPRFEALLAGLESRRRRRPATGARPSARRPTSPARSRR